MTRKEQINLYLKERNIPINSLEANSIIEGIKWSDEHPNLLNNEKYHTVQVSVLDELYGKVKLYEELFEQDRIDIIKYLIEKGYPVTTGGDVPTFEQSMQAMTDLYNYKKEEWLETACHWLDVNFPEIENTGSWYKKSFIEQFKKFMIIKDETENNIK